LDYSLFRGDDDVLGTWPDPGDIDGSAH
jgi:hypothetical protein